MRNFLLKFFDLEFNKKNLFALVVFITLPLLVYIFTALKFNLLISIGILILIFFSCFFALQFFGENEKLDSTGKNLLLFFLLNTIVSTIMFATGGISSHYYFFVYILILFSSVTFKFGIVFLEVFLIFFINIFIWLTSKDSLSQIFSQGETYAQINLFSPFLMLLLVIPLTIFIYNLRKKTEILRHSKELLYLQDLEDETLLTEINQGIIILDSELNIVKFSKWIEQNFEIQPSAILGKELIELSFMDYITGEKIQKDNYFYRNLFSENPKKLNWRVLYKNKYGKIKKFIIKQIPLEHYGKFAGFLLSVKTPQSSIDIISSSFTQMLAFRMNSSVGMIKNFLSFDGPVDEETKIKIGNHIELLSGILKDMNERDRVASGDYEIIIEETDLKNMISLLVSAMPEKKAGFWTVSPYFKNQKINYPLDTYLFEQIIRYLIIGSFYLSSGKGISISLDNGEGNNYLKIVITTDAMDGLPKDMDLSDEFFGGRLVVLSKYKGSGLEISNAKLFCSYLDFDFDARISNNKINIEINLPPRNFNKK